MAIASTKISLLMFLLHRRGAMSGIIAIDSNITPKGIKRVGSILYIVIIDFVVVRFSVCLVNLLGAEPQNALRRERESLLQILHRKCRKFWLSLFSNNGKNLSATTARVARGIGAINMRKLQFLIVNVW